MERIPDRDALDAVTLERLARGLGLVFVEAGETRPVKRLPPCPPIW